MYYSSERSMGRLFPISIPGPAPFSWTMDQRTKMVSEPSVHQFPLLVYTGRLRKIRGFSGGSGEGTHGKFFRRRNADFETSETGKYRNAR